MKKIINKDSIAANGTSLMGYFVATYNEVVAKFGEPIDVNSDGDKVTVEWIVVFEDDTVATIYDWKSDSPRYTPDECYEWHIGGHKTKAAEYILAEMAK
jgi:hypothetical protein